MNVSCDNTRFLDEVLNNHEYSFLMKYDTVIDIGCNIGSFSFWIKPFSKQIYSIDISKENIQLLDETIKENNIQGIKTYNLGIAGETGERTIDTLGRKARSGAWKLGGGQERIKCLTLADFMKENEIEYADLVKIDVEGGEIEIFNNFPSDKVGTIIGENHGGNILEVISLLERVGYEFNKIGGNHFVARKI